MRQLTFAENLTVFLLFFGIAVFDALASRVWWRLVFWGAIAVLFAVLAWTGRHRTVDDLADESAASPR